MANYKITVKGIVKTEEIHVMGFGSLISFNNLKENYKNDYKNLSELLKDVNGKKTKLSIVKGADKNLKNIAIISGAIVELSGLAENILKQKRGLWAILPPHPTVLKTVLEGPYDYLKEAWDKSFEFLKNNKLIVDAYSSAWEVYKSEETNSLITEIYIPLIITKDQNIEKLSI